jgi:hypothetical protein
MGKIKSGVVVRTIKVAGTHPCAHIHEFEAYPKDAPAPAGIQIPYEDCKYAAGAFDLNAKELRKLFTVEGNHIIRVGWPSAQGPGPGVRGHFHLTEQDYEILIGGNDALLDRKQVEIPE